MAYCKKTILAGKTLEIEKYHRAGQGKNSIRQPKAQLSSEEQQKRNEALAIRKLTWEINGNFGPGDYHLTLTYRDPAPEPEEAKKQLAKYLRRLRGAYRAAGKELKYIAVTEYKYQRIHHHLIVNRIDLGVLTGLWERGQVRAAILDKTGSYWRLAEYLVKETRRSFSGAPGTLAGKRRWTPSKNLKRPEPKVEEVQSGGYRKEPAKTLKRGGKQYFLDPDRPWERYVDLAGWEHLIAYYRETDSGQGKSHRR